MCLLLLNLPLNLTGEQVDSFKKGTTRFASFFQLGHELLKLILQRGRSECVAANQNYLDPDSIFKGEGDILSTWLTMVLSANCGALLLRYFRLNNQARVAMNWYAIEALAGLLGVIAA